MATDKIAGSRGGKGGPNPGEDPETGLDLAHVPVKGPHFNSLIYGAPQVQWVSPKPRAKPILTMDDLNLHPALLKNLKDWSIGEVTLVQRYILPAVMGHEGDIWCKAPTGTGKTFAYIVALLQRLVDNKLPEQMGSLKLRDGVSGKKGKGSRKGRPKLGLPLRPLALIVQPTREQAHQTFHHLCHLAKGLNLAIGHDIGQMECPPSHRRRSEELDILVGTPGRLSVTQELILPRLPRKELGKEEIANQTVPEQESTGVLCSRIEVPARWRGNRLEVVLLDDGDKLFHKDFDEFRKVLEPELPPEALRVVLSAAFPRDVQEAQVAKFLRPHHSSLNVRLVLMDEVQEVTKKRNLLGPDAMHGYVSSINLVSQEFILPRELTKGLGKDDMAKLTLPDRETAFGPREKDKLLLSLLSDVLVQRKAEQQEDPEKPPISIMVFMERVDQVERVMYHRNIPKECEKHFCRDISHDEFHWGSQRLRPKPELASRLFHHLQRYLGDWELGDEEGEEETQVPEELRHPQPYVWLHRRLPQHQRSQHIQTFRLLEAFFAKKTPIMICTSVAARGIDLPFVDLVINYDMAAQFDGRGIVNLGPTGISVSEMRSSPVVQKAVGIHVQRIGLTPT